VTHGPTSSIIRPRLRGVADIGAAAIAIPAVAALVDHARPGGASVASAVYGASLVMVLLCSAIYHRAGWPLRVALWLRKIDHASIYLLIAGSATPVVYTLVPGPGTGLIAAMWIAAALGVLKTLLWPRAPRQLSVALYVLLGVLPVPFVADLRETIGDAEMDLLIVGGAIYIAGAVVYARRWPNPAPFTFGYHEIFHLFVFAAALAHYVAIWSIVG
jgi:hemolysin III